jgi:choline transport protein
MGKSFHARPQPPDSHADPRYSGLPFSSWFTRIRVVDGVPLPVNSVLASLCISVIIALLNLVGDRVFNSITGLVTGTLALTYSLSIGCVLWRRCFGEPLPPARWSLGRWGLPCNIVALLYSVMSIFISFFPLFYGTGPSDMNWLVSSQSNGIRNVKLTIRFLRNTGPVPSLLSFSS